MRVAGSIILGVIGAILYFAVTVEVAGIDLPTVGIIMMVAAGVWFLIELVRGFSGDTTRTGDGRSGPGDAQATGARDLEQSSSR